MFFFSVVFHRFGFFHPTLPNGARVYAPNQSFQWGDTMNRLDVVEGFLADKVNAEQFEFSM